MRLVPSIPAEASAPAPMYRRAYRITTDDLIPNLVQLPTEVAALFEATNMGNSPEAEAIALAYGRIIGAAEKLLEEVSTEPQEALAHGIAFGLWFAGRPELIRECPESTRKHLWTSRLPGREELLKAAANVL